MLWECIYIFGKNNPIPKPNLHILISFSVGMKFVAIKKSMFRSPPTSQRVTVVIFISASVFCMLLFLPLFCFYTCVFSGICPGVRRCLPLRRGDSIGRDRVPACSPMYFPRLLVIPAFISITDILHLLTTPRPRNTGPRYTTGGRQDNQRRPMLP